LWGLLELPSFDHFGNYQMEGNRGQKKLDTQRLRLSMEPVMIITVRVLAAFRRKGIVIEGDGVSEGTDLRERGN